MDENVSPSIPDADKKRKAKKKPLKISPSTVNFLLSLLPNACLALGMVVTITLLCSSQTRNLIVTNYNEIFSSETKEKQFLHSLCLSITGLFTAAAISLLGGAPTYGKSDITESTAKGKKAAKPTVATQIFTFLYSIRLHPALAWLLQECPAFILPTYFLIKYPSDVFTNSTPARFLLAMFLFHYFNRSFIYPLRKTSGKTIPILVSLLAFVFCVCNGYIQGRYLTAGWAPERLYSETYLYDPRFILGTLLFFTGWAINVQADEILLNLRKPGETGYKIPRGGFFEYVSAANFAGEILEWTGWAIACSTPPAFLFAFWTILNTAPRGYIGHLWYKKKFGKKYPASRKALIPGIL
eukprot:g4300.t1